MIHRKDAYRANPGDEMWREAEPGRFLLYVLRGEVECTAADGRGDFRAGPGYVLGADATFGAIPYAYTARVSKPLVALRVDATVLNDIQEDHYDFALGTLAHFSREEIRLLDKRAGELD
jgi:CRP-like cAMP-binding protein